MADEQAQFESLLQNLMSTDNEVRTHSEVGVNVLPHVESLFWSRNVVAESTIYVEQFSNGNRP